MQKALMAAVAAASLAVASASFADQHEDKVVEVGGVGAVKVATVTATVQAIDLEKRIVTLKGPEGNVFDLHAGDEVRNLPQVKVGDVVVTKYYESVAIDVLKGGVGIRSKESQTATSRAPLGAKPAGAVATTTTIVANVTNVDAKKKLVTLEGPSGKSVKVKVIDPAVMKEIKAGEQVEMVITEALAIAVESPKKKKK
jgi:Cu/Ag efflux protein CusF